ncbi:hypothetical protein ACQCSJ_26120, partial [Ralstonia pseudosolanacearum]
VGSATVSELLDRVKAKVLEAQAHPDVPLRRQGLWESWSPLDNTPAVASAEPAMPARASAPIPAPVPATDGLLPTIDPTALH